MLYWRSSAAWCSKLRPYDLNNHQDFLIRTLYKHCITNNSLYILTFYFPDQNRGFIFTLCFIKLRLATACRCKVCVIDLHMSTDHIEFCSRQGVGWGGGAYSWTVAQFLLTGKIVIRPSETDLLWPSTYCKLPLALDLGDLSVFNRTN